MRDLQELPRIHDGLSFLYVERCHVEQHKKAIVLIDEKGKVPVPCASLALLMIGPGTRVTHAAIKNLSECGCLVAWCGEHGVRLYAQGTGKTRSARHLLRQARLYANIDTRAAVVRRMYELRFGEKVDAAKTIQQMRGMEGARVRMAYLEASKRTGIPWAGRKYDRTSWNKSDPVNRALSAANACLYGLCHAAIVTAGYSPAIGFIHTGKQLSFVYDVADLYKVEITIPIAFAVVSKDVRAVGRRARIACREAFKSRRLLKRIIPDIQHVLDVEKDQVDEEDAGLETDDEAFDGETSYPGGLWDPDDGVINGGVNFDVPGDG